MTSPHDQDPVIIELDEADPMPSPAEVPSVVDADPAPTGRAMQGLAGLVSRPRSFLSIWFWRLLVSLVVFFLSVAAWDFVSGLVQRNQVLGWIALGLVGVFAVVCLAILVREFAALSRLRTVERLHDEAERVVADSDLTGARSLVERLNGFYAGREDTRWGRERLLEGADQAFDADTLIDMAEDRLIAPLDDMAMREVEAAARQVATVTALVPLAFADLLAALTVNLRMIRRVAEIYGGRSGTIGAWRLTQAVIAHLVATGAVAVGDDLLGSLGGGHLLGKISRRFGEGLVNGALTARVGVAAMEVCRPLPFSPERRPKVTGLVRRALTGLFDFGKG